MRLLIKSLVGHARRHPLQLLLALVGLSLGVAVVVAMDLAIESSRAAFKRASTSIAGSATHEIVAPAGAVPEQLVVRMAVAAPRVRFAPMLAGQVRVLNDVDDASEPEASIFGDDVDADTRALLARMRASTRLEVLGIDPFAEAPFRSLPGALQSAAEPSSQRSALAVASALLTTPGAVVTNAATAARLGLATGDTFAASAAGRELTLTLVAAPDLRASAAGLTSDAAAAAELGAAALDDRLLMDIATAQRLLKRPGELDQIAVRADTDLALAELAAVAATLPDSVSLRPAGASASATGRMTASFELNLRMLSLLALVVGMFLAYNTESFSVVQRREQFGALRALGVGSGELFAMVLCEALLLALAAAVLGVALGLLLATELTALVARTVNDLYTPVSVREVALSPIALARGPLLGIAAALVAASIPAFEAASVTPRAALQRSQVEQRTLAVLPRIARGGVAVLAVGVVLSMVEVGGLPAGFVALFAVVLGFALVAPLATQWLLRALEVPSRLFGLPGQLAVRGASASLSRVAVAVVALSVAVGATVGIALMVKSFRDTVTSWLATTLQADLYVSAAGAGFTPEAAIAMRALEGVGELSLGASRQVQFEGVPTEVTGIGMAPQSYTAFSVTDGPIEDVWPVFEAGGVLIGEPLAYRRGLARGDTLTLPTRAGPEVLAIAAVFRDYESERGSVVMALDTYSRLFGDVRLTGIGVYLAPGADMDAVRERIVRGLGTDTDLLVISSAAIRNASLKIFDRTFKVTEVLRLLAMAVAFFGILSALLALELERAREFAVLRAQGLTRSQLWALICAQTGTLGVVSAALAAPFGIAMAVMLVEVVNRRAFGWTLDLSLSWRILLESSALAVLAALLAGIYPAWRMARARPGDALRGSA